MLKQTQNSYTCVRGDQKHGAHLIDNVIMNAFDEITDEYLDKMTSSFQCFYQSFRLSIPVT